jgi:hypothetical protein
MVLKKNATSYNNLNKILDKYGTLGIIALFSGATDYLTYPNITMYTQLSTNLYANADYTYSYYFGNQQIPESYIISWTVNSISPQSYVYLGFGPLSKWNTSNVSDLTVYFLVFNTGWWICNSQGAKDGGAGLSTFQLKRTENKMEYRIGTGAWIDFTSNYQTSPGFSEIAQLRYAIYDFNIGNPVSATVTIVPNP